MKFDIAAEVRLVAHVHVLRFTSKLVMGSVYEMHKVNNKKCSRCKYNFLCKVLVRIAWRRNLE